MRIRVDNIPEDGLQLNGTIDPSSIEFNMPDYSLVEPLAFVGRATRAVENVVVKGRLTGSVQSQCGRCLDSFSMPVDVAVRIVFAPEQEPSAEDGFVTEADENFSYYAGNTIDLSREAKDLILVNLPIRPICGEDCKGLCPGCGVDLNKDPCKCGGGGAPSPFDELRELKQRIE